MPQEAGRNGGKEPGFEASQKQVGEWRVAYGLDPARRAILLTGGSKSGAIHGKFYERLIGVPDWRDADHLSKLCEMNHGGIAR